MISARCQRRESHCQI